eukprot:2503066-Alexandrium_andersonii.AAC.1
MCIRDRQSCGLAPHDGAPGSVALRAMLLLGRALLGPASWPLRGMPGSRRARRQGAATAVCGRLPLTQYPAS